MNKINRKTLIPGGIAGEEIGVSPKRDIPPAAKRIENNRA